MILPSNLTQLYKVKKYELHFFKNLSPKFFQTLDLSCPLSTLKKLVKSFSMDIFSFQDITKDRCETPGLLTPYRLRTPDAHDMWRMDTWCPSHILDT